MRKAIKAQHAPDTLRHLLTIGVSCCALAAAAPVAAQEVETIPDGLDIDDFEAEDVVIVTGSRIRRAPDESIPVTTIDGAEFDYRAFVNTIDALEDLPFVGVGVNNEGNSTQFGDNNAFVNLLGFGTQRTLTLIDGRRMVTSNQGTVFVPGNNSGAQVDLTIINPALIKNTEIQTVGSGPIYGADAVAGVVNVILDREFEGLEFTAQGGITQRGDGEQYRVSGAWGKEVLGGRGHIILAGEYFNSDNIQCDPDGRSFCNLAGNGDVNNPFSRSGSDGIPDQVFQPNLRNPQIPTSGLVAVGQLNSGSTANFFFPTTTGNSANDTAFNQFVDQTGLSPFEFALANPDLNGINPLLFAGTFGLTSGFTTVPNTDAATLALGLDRLAVPLTFNSSGELIPFDLGSFVPPLAADQNDISDGDGFGDPLLTTLRAEQERISVNGLWSYELTNNIRYEGDFWFSEIENSQPQNNVNSQTPGASLTAANFGLPIFINENAFLSDEARAQLIALNDANGGNLFGEIGGQPFFSLTRSLTDLTVGGEEGNLSRTFRTSHALIGEFERWDRNFYWDVAFAWSRNTSQNRAATDILDIEFALATDVVDDGSGNIVCRQQTLAAPEAVTVRNPLLANVNIDTPGGVVPTQAQIDACVPLNLLGEGVASQAAIDYVTANGDSRNQAEQYYAAISFGGEIIETPAGAIQFNSQFEWRREELEFTPGEVFALGLARQTIGQPGIGAVRFFEGGTEFNVPVFGEDFTVPGIQRLEFDGAVRVVNRTGSGTPLGLQGGFVDVDSTTDVTFTAGGRWSPINGITFRGNRTRSVRSPSIVESLGAPQTGFSALAGFFPCNANFIDGGPQGGIRRENCEALESSLGLAPGTFAGLAPPAGTVPAGVGGNPTLQNEVANNWTVGAVFQPAFIPNLTIEADWINLRLDDQIDLQFFGTACFDQPTFPNTEIGGVRVCEALTLAVPDPNDPSRFIIPETNIITGSPTPPPGIVGSLAPVQEPYTIAAAQFSNVNAGSIRLSALNTRISYGFDVNDLLPRWPNLGSVNLVGNVYYIDRFQLSDSGTFVDDIDNEVGEPGDERFQTRLDFTHRIGRLSHTWQWFRQSKSVQNVDDTQPADEEADFARPAFNTFNLNIGYEINDNFTARLVVNNLTDARLLPEVGIEGGAAEMPLLRIGDPIGRNFIFAVSARF